MGDLKSAISMMKSNNQRTEDGEGIYDNALKKQKKALQYFMKEVPERIE